MGILKKLLVCVLIVFGLSACTSMHFDPSFTKPASLDMTPPKGPPEYEQGWRDGCETGIAGYGSAFNKLFHTAKKNVNYVRNPVYNQIWRDAYAYCRVFVKTTQLHGWGNHNNAFGIEALIKIPKIIDG